MPSVLYWLIQIVLVVALLAMIGVPIYLSEKRVKKKKMEEAFAGRQPLDERTFYERYFQSAGVPADVAIRVRRILEDELGVDLSRLTADDDFTRNLSFFWEYDSLTDVEVVMRIEEEFDIKISDEEAGKAHTVGNLVDLVWHKLGQRTA
jgi:acyl carrier protein